MPGTKEDIENVLNEIVSLFDIIHPIGNKVAQNIRFDAEILAAFKATGKGWQTRMNNALRDWLKTHTPTPSP